MHGFPEILEFAARLSERITKANGGFTDVREIPSNLKVRAPNLRVNARDLRVGAHEVRVSGRELRVSGRELRVGAREPRVSGRGLRGSARELKVGTPRFNVNASGSREYISEVNGGKPIDTGGSALRQESPSSPVRCADFRALDSGTRVLGYFHPSAVRTGVFTGSGLRAVPSHFTRLRPLH